MRRNRRGAVDAAARTPAGSTWGVILGTLGRQGNPRVAELLRSRIEASGRKVLTLLLSEVFPGKLALMSGSVAAWVQVACPR